MDTKEKGFSGERGNERNEGEKRMFTPPLKGREKNEDFERCQRR